MLLLIQRFFVLLETRDRSPYVLFTVALVVGALRGQLESLFFNLEIRNSDQIAYIPFYFSLAFIYAAILRLLPGASPKRVFNGAVIATSLGILPPILDLLLGSAETHIVFYGYYFIHDLSNFPWLGYGPAQHYPTGECIVIWGSILLCALYGYFATNRISHAILGAALGYVIFLLYALLIPAATSYFLFGYLPNFESYALLPYSEKRLILYFMSISQLLAGICCYLIAKKSTLQLILSRIPHYLPFFGAMLWGVSFGAGDRIAMICALISLGLLSVSATFMNAYFDAQRPSRSVVSRADMELLNLAFFQLLLMFFLCGFRFVIPILVNLVLCIYYHYPFGNGRKHYLTAMKIEGLWGLLCFLAGLSTLNSNAVHLHLGVILPSMILCFGGFTIISIVKDAKDIEEDSSSGRRTLFVLMKNHGMDIERFLRSISWPVTIVYATVIVIFREYFGAHPFVTACAVIILIAIWFSLRRAQSIIGFKFFLVANFVFMACMALVFR